MHARIDVPQLPDLDGLPVEVAPADEPGVVSVTGWAGDGSAVTLTWDEVAASVHLRWTQPDEEVLLIERETVSKVSVLEDRGPLEFRAWSDADSLRGQLIVRLGARVGVSDALLRTELAPNCSREQVNILRDSSAQGCVRRPESISRWSSTWTS